MLFLDKIEAMSIFHLRDLANRTKMWIECEKVKVYHAPQYEGLTTKDMLKWAEGSQDVKAALPDVKSEREKLHRDYVSTVIYTLCGKPFKQWVDQIAAERDAKILEEQDKMIMLDPAIANILKNSTRVSTTKGISSHLLKVSVLRYLA